MRCALTVSAEQQVIVTVGFAGFANIVAFGLGSVPDFHNRRIAEGLRKARATSQEAPLSGGRLLTLTTFRAVARNLPFYTRLGFEKIPRETLRPELAAVVSEEADRGLDPDTRVVMGYRCVPPVGRE